MIAFLIGGEGRFMDAMINKLNKDGHRVYLLTGTKNSHTSYQKVFEKYNFEYDSDSIREILVSANPDIVIFMGAHDTRYDWENPRKTSVQFTADLTNVISAYSSVKKAVFFIFPLRKFLEGHILKILKRTSLFQQQISEHLHWHKVKKFARAITIHEECSQSSLEWIISMEHQKKARRRIIHALR